MNAYWKSASKLCSGKTGLPAAVDWKSGLPPCHVGLCEIWLIQLVTSQPKLYQFYDYAPKLWLAQSQTQVSPFLKAHGKGRRSLGSPTGIVRQQAEKEKGGGGKEGLTQLTFIGTHTHMPSALSDTLHIWYLLVKKKNNTQAEVVRERKVQSEGCKLERYINTHKGLCGDSVVIITAACP